MTIHRFWRMPASFAGTAIAFTALESTAQLFFESEQVIYQNPVHDPEVILTADIDGDTDLDLVVLGGAARNARIVWFENTDGLGTFGDAREISAPVDKATAIVAVDIDGDTHLDIAAASSSNDDKVFWFENTDGLGTFGPRQIIASSSNVSDLASADFDGDTDMDLVWAGGGTVRWAENTDGLGSFAAPVTIANVSDVRHVAVGRIDADSDIDIVFASDSFVGGEVLICDNTDGLGSFGAAQVISLVNGVQDLHLADIGNDTDLDILYTTEDFFDGIIGMLPNDGSGNFGSLVTVATSFDFKYRVTTADLDGDTDLDVLYTNGTFNEVYSVTQSGVGGSTFGAAQLINGNAVAVFGLAAGQLDGAGGPDVVIGYQPSEVGWYPNTGGTLGSLQSVCTGFEQFDHLLIEDLENDNTPDLLIPNSADGIVHRIPNNGAGVFAAPQSLITGVVGANFITLGDVNNDNDPDLVVSQGAESALSFFPATAGPTFGAEVVLDNTKSQPTGSIIADIDGVNGPDIIVAYSAEDECATFLNNGAGGFGAYTALPGTISSFPVSVTAGIIDGGSDVDVITGAFNTGKLYQYTNSGGGTFASASELEDLTNGANWLYLVDLDGDTDLDLLGRLNVRIFWKENTAGTFGVAQTIATTSQSTMMIPVDFNKDTFIDIVSVDESTREVAWHENDGSGNFTKQVIATLLQQPFFVGADDMDNDGDLDIVVASVSEVKVVWFEQIEEPPPPPGPLEIWAGSFGLAGDDLLATSDKDKDGVILADEFAQNMNPTVPDSAQLPETAGESGTVRIFFDEGGFGIFKSMRINGIFIRHKDAATIGLSYLIQGSGELSTWSPYTAVLSTTSINDTYERVHVRQNVFPANPDIYFGRLKITYAPPPP